MIGWNPCGLTVDLLRTCYRVKMRTTTFTDPVDVVWFRVADDTPAAPGPCSYRSRMWVPQDQYPNTGLGEQTELCCERRVLRYYNGAKPALLTEGQYACGSEHAALYGADPDDPLFAVGPDGLAPCCDSDAPIHASLRIGMRLDTAIPPIVYPATLRIGLRLDTAIPPIVYPATLRIGLRLDTAIPPDEVPAELRVGLRLEDVNGPLLAELRVGLRLQWSLPLPPVPTGCCPQPIPRDLVATITNAGACNGAYPMRYDPDPGQWSLEALDFGSCEFVQDDQLLFRCEFPDDGWRLYSNNFASGPYNPSTESCSPFLVCFEGVDLTLCCEGVTNATVCIGIAPPCCPVWQNPGDVLYYQPIWLDWRCTSVGEAWRLDPVDEKGCIWYNSDPATGEQVLLDLRFGRGLLTVMDADDTVLVVYRVSPFVCGEENVMDKVFNPDSCVWPATVPVSAVRF